MDLAEALSGQQPYGPVPTVELLRTEGFSNALLIHSLLEIGCWKLAALQPEQNDYLATPYPYMDGRYCLGIYFSRPLAGPDVTCRCASGRAKDGTEDTRHC